MQRFDADAARVTRLVERGILALTGQSQAADAWRQFVGPDDVVGIKIVARGGPLFSVRKPLVDAIVDGLKSAGVAEHRILVWDKYQSNLTDAGYAIRDSGDGVRVMGVIPSVGFDPEFHYHSPHAGKIIWGDLRFDAGEEKVSAESYFTRILSRQVTKLINVAVLANHGQVGLSGCLFNVAAGSVDNTRRFETSAAASAIAVPEICATPVLRDKFALHIIDGLLGQYALGPNFHPEFTWHHGAIYFSTDPVALDTIALEEIEARRRHVGMKPVGERARHIANAARLGLGTNAREQIEVIRLEAESP